MGIGASFPLFKLNEKVAVTPDGGLAILMINKTGAASIKGYVVEPDSVVDGAVDLVSDGDIDPIGVIYNAGVADGSQVWVVVSGIAHVYYGTAVTRATFSRVAISGDSVASGQAVNEALPTPPFATDKHFQEIGHPIESIGSPGLALTVLHFN